MKKSYLILALLLAMGCGDIRKWFDSESGAANNTPLVKAATIDTSEFKHGQLRISGTCGEDGEILLVQPIQNQDNRIIGAPKCSHGRYEVLTSTFGRPPCEIVVEYGGDKSIKAKVEGTEFYCSQ